MPGKVTPLIPEAVIQAAMQVIGNDTTILLGGQSCNFELNVAMPVMAYNLLQSIEILANAGRALNAKCIQGITANREKCAAYIERSLALVTRLVPQLGYDRAAAISKEAWETDKTIREVVTEQGIVSEEELK
jgi:fumarate hydratase class II